MTRTTMTLLIACTLAACEWANPWGDDESLPDEQAREQAELRQDQSEERRDLAESQVGERRRQAQAVRDERGERTREAAAAQSEAAERLATLVTQSCAAVPQDRQTSCPLDARDVTTFRDIDRGVSLQLDPSVSSADSFESRLDCYRAHQTAARAASPSALAPMEPNGLCMVDLQRVDVTVSQDRELVHVALTADSNATVEALRARARALAVQASR